ncbi:methionyl-tRNA formyltransferase [Desulfobaculum senezii]
MGSTEKTPLRIVFMGTPDFARTSLEHLAAWDGGEIVGVYTQPDRPCGRGQVCKPSAVKQLALEQGWDVYQPVNFKDSAAIDELAALRPDVLVVAAYGLILPQAVLDIAPHGAVNVHSSLLPKYRGAAPIQRAILHGDDVTGVTIMQMDKGMDTGDILKARALAIGKDDTAEILHDELAELGGKLLVETLDAMVAGTLRRIKQDEDKATYAAKLSKSEGQLDWTRPAQEVHNRARAMHPWPGAYFFWCAPDRDKPLRIALTPGEVGPSLEEYGNPEPGTIIGDVDGKLAIACADKVYLAAAVKPAGKKCMTAEGFCCGYLNRCAE